MMQAVHHRVKRLIRLQIGPLKLGSLRSGKWRPLADQEREDLLKMAEQK
jgi:23S rRNA pseudouridine2605 synthase